jgi:mevalonate kinase
MHELISLLENQSKSISIANVMQQIDTEDLLNRVKQNLDQSSQNTFSTYHEWQLTSIQQKAEKMLSKDKFELLK